MPQQIFRFHQILLSQEFLAANPLHLPIEFVHKHGRLRRAVPLATRHDSGGFVVLSVSCSAPSLSSTLFSHHFAPYTPFSISEDPPLFSPSRYFAKFPQIERDSNRRRLLNSSPPPPIQTTPGYSPPPTTLPTHRHIGRRLSSLSISTLLQPLRSLSPSPLRACRSDSRRHRYRCDFRDHRAASNAVPVSDQHRHRLAQNLLLFADEIGVALPYCLKCRPCFRPATVVQPCQSVPERFRNEAGQPRNNPD